MKRKMVLIDAFLPDLRGKQDFTAHGSGSTVKAAVSRAIGELLKQPRVKGRRLHTMKLTISISEPVERPTVEPELGISEEECAQAGGRA